MEVMAIEVANIFLIFTLKAQFNTHTFPIPKEDKRGLKDETKRRLGMERGTREIQRISGYIVDFLLVTPNNVLCCC